MKVETLRPFLLNPLIQDHQVLESLKILNQTYLDRKDLKKQKLDENIVSSYVLYYLSTNIKKLDFVLGQLNEDTKNNILNGSILDFGCGPGTYSLGFLQESNFKGNLKLFDKSDVMIDQAKKLINGLYPNSSCEFVNAVEKCDTIIFGNSFNEIDIIDFRKILKAAKPTNIILIEPGTKEVFQKLMGQREFLIENKFNCVYPCASINKKCPIIEDTDNWCHQIMKTTHDISIERICQLAKKDRRTMPMIAHVYSKDGIKDERSIIFRSKRETKFSFEFEVCGYVGDDVVLSLSLIHI